MDSDDEGWENVVYGTPLEPLDEDAPRSRARALQCDTVRDAAGRRRFHGAFTGGFSAGHFNTVATPAGFTPATFVSSRRQRHTTTATEPGQQQQQRQHTPHDFMDEEDLSEFGIAPQRIAAKTEFSGGASDQWRAASGQQASLYHESAIPGAAPLHQLLKPVLETVGVRILKCLGWRPGQGIGPRVTRAQKRLQLRKVYGCALPSTAAAADDDDDGDDDELWLNRLLAPVDSAAAEAVPSAATAASAAPKSDRFGLGYSGLSRHSVLASRHQSTALRQAHRDGKIAIIGQAFGVGALEEDDEDLYTVEDMSQYDFEEQSASTLPPQSSKSSTGTTARTKLSSPWSGSTVSQPVAGFVSGAGSGATAGQSVRRSRLHAPPQLPTDYRSDWRLRDPVRGPALPAATRRRFADCGVSRFGLETPLTSVGGAVQQHAGLDRHRLSAAARAEIIGEHMPLSAPPRTVPGRTEAVDGASAADSAEIERAAETAVSVSSNSSSSSQLARPSEIKPFASDTDKQRRYETYLKLKNNENRKVLLFSLQPPAFTEHQRHAELAEFQRAAAIFVPLSGALAARFRSAGTTADVDQPESAAAAAAAAADRFSDAAVQAAVCGMHGRLTHTEQVWCPAPLLCKRFNVRPPRHTAATPHELDEVTRKPSLFDTVPAAYGATSLAPGDPSTGPSSTTIDSDRDAIAAEGGGGGAAALSSDHCHTLTVQHTLPEEVDTRCVEVGGSGSSTPGLEQPANTERPPMDLFSAIFDATDSEDDESGAAADEAAQVAGDSSTNNHNKVTVTADAGGGGSGVDDTTTTSSSNSNTTVINNNSSSGGGGSGQLATQLATTSDRSAANHGTQQQQRQMTSPAAAASVRDHHKIATKKEEGKAAAGAEAQGADRVAVVGAAGAGGLFDNIDLDAINQWSRRETVPHLHQHSSPATQQQQQQQQQSRRVDSIETTVSAGAQKQQQEREEYGPALPPRPSTLPAVPAGHLPPLSSRYKSSTLVAGRVGGRNKRHHPPCDSQSSDESRPKRPRKSKKSRTKRKEKRMKERRKRDSSTSSSSSSSSSSSDGDRVLQKLQKLSRKSAKKKRKKHKSV